MILRRHPLFVAVAGVLALPVALAGRRQAARIVGRNPAPRAVPPALGESVFFSQRTPPAAPALPPAGGRREAPHAPVGYDRPIDLDLGEPPLPPPPIPFDGRNPDA